MQNSVLRSVLFVVLAGGCVGSAQVGYSAEVSAPEMVVISPGVQVIADYDEPIFYSESYYWKSEGGHWYRSANHSRGWVRFDSAPVAIRTIERPSAYVHYHASARATPVVVRDHRNAAPAARDDRPSNIGTERKQDQQERKQEKKETKKQEKQDKKDDKRDKKDRHD